MIRFLSALVLGLALFGVAKAQSPAETLRGGGKSYQATDLPKSLRAVAFGTGDSSNSLGLFGFSFMRSAGDRDDQSLYFINLSGAVLVEPDEFGALLDGKVKRIHGYAIDLSAMVKVKQPEGEMGPPTPVFMEVWLEGSRISQWTPKPEISVESIIAKFSGKADDPAALRTQGLNNANRWRRRSSFTPATQTTAIPTRTPPRRPNSKSFRTTRTPSSGRVRIRKADAFSTTPRSPA